MSESNTKPRRGPRTAQSQQPPQDRASAREQQAEAEAQAAIDARKAAGEDVPTINLTELKEKRIADLNKMAKGNKI